MQKIWDFSSQNVWESLKDSGFGAVGYYDQNLV